MSNDMPTPTPTNALRTQMITRAVAQAQDGKLAITVRNVAMFLPGPTAFDAKLKAMEDFALDDDDLRPFLPPIISAETFDRLKDVELVLPDQPAEVVESPQAHYERLEQRSIALERERNDLKFQHQTAIRDELTARNALDQVARTFLAGFGKPQTPDELLKDHARGEAERRRAIAAGEITPSGHRISTVGPSQLDRFMYATGGAQGRRSGPNGEPLSGARRGAYRPNAEQMRVAKLPSER
jgi:hypothetical protein